MTGFLQITHDGSVCHVRNTNVDGCAAFTASYVTGLTDLLQSFRPATQDLPAAVILSGPEAGTEAGPGPGFFCSGADLADLSAASSGHYAARRAGVDGLNALMRAVRACPCPVIAAVEGGADAAGIALMLACDLIVADSRARFTATQITAGLTPEAGLTVLLSAGLPRWLVAEMLLTATPVTAGRLYELGVVNRLVERGAAVEAAAGLARDLSSYSPDAVRATKTLLGQVARTSFDDQLEAEADAFATALGSPEGRKRLAACLEQYNPAQPGKQKRTD